MVGCTRSMPIHAKAFWAISFFLCGVLLASAVEEWSSRFLVVAFVTAIGTLAFAAFRRKQFAVLFLFTALGAGYFFFYDAQTGKDRIPYGAVQAVSGIVADARSGLERQELTVVLEEPARGRIRINTTKYPAYAYGDRIALSGTIEELPKPSNRDIRERINGRMRFPEIALMERGRGSQFKAGLLGIKSYVERAFRRAFPPDEAAFLSGLTLGETAAFSDEFREQLRVTGTSHLVALSGYNITILARGIAALFLWFLSRRKTFVLTIAGIAGFVVMTGAEASVVRAAIMGFIALLAEQVGRVHSFRNAIAFAAFLMALGNPRVLVWDVGFQLSFAAVIGLIYLKPALVRVLKVRPEPGFLGWRENLWTTIAAQLAVLPILLGVFGFFSPLSIVVNLLVLTFIPVTMLLGFLVAAVSLVAFYAALPIAWVTRIFLGYELGVIDLFSRFEAKLAVPGFGISFAILYYGGLIAFMMFARRKSYAAERA